MACLREILSQHPKALLVDACSERVQVVLFESGRPTRHESIDGEAGTGVFKCAAAFSEDLGSVDAYLFCEGPGSILGVRTAAAAIRAWRIQNPKPVWSYQSLALMAQALPEGTLVVSDARRDSWHAFRRGEGLRRIPSSALAQAQNPVTPSTFKRWSKVPEGITLAEAPYDLSEILPKVMDSDLFAVCDAPDAFLHEEPSYALWSPQIHRAPS